MHREISWPRVDLVIGYVCIPAVLLLAATGCYVGLDSVVFATKTQVAIDADTEPSALDIGYKRDEAVIAPVFESGEVLPVMATIRHGAYFNSFFSDQSFATGDAAVVMAQAFTDPRDYCPKDGPGFPGHVEGVCPNDRTRPTTRGGAVVGVSPVNIPPDILGKISYFFTGSEERKRYFFGTKTGLGLHVDWTASEAPRAITVGFKRKELALVPLMEVPSATAGREGLVDVKLASLIATAGAGTKVAKPSETGLTVSQTFATGDAATFLASNPGVRNVLGAQIAPGGEEAIVRKQVEDVERQLDNVEAVIKAFKADSSKQQPMVDKANELKLNPDQKTRTDSFEQDVRDAGILRGVKGRENVTVLRKTFAPGG